MSIEQSKEEEQPKEEFVEIDERKFFIGRGEPLPLGATVQPGGINFSIFSRHATAVTLVISLPRKFAKRRDELLCTGLAGDPDGDNGDGSLKRITEVPLDPGVNKTGDVWHVFIQDLDPGVHYGYRMDCAPNSNPKVQRFDKEKVLLDPYAHTISGRLEWGILSDADNAHPGRFGERCSIVLQDDFDWGDDQPLNVPLADSIIYELHVRGFTRHSSSGVRAPGTFLGLMEKIPYLESLGITAVELLPVYEFEERDTDRINPTTGEPLLNYWGYHPISFFALKNSYGSNKEDGAVVREFKSMVKAFHEAGIEVILDVVFNHTAEGDEHGTTFSLRGIDNSVYYIVDMEEGAYHNYSGCGNTVNCNHPVVRDMILDSLRYWSTEMHVDGFRFDLASILGRGRDGSVLHNPPLLEQIAADPVLANTKLIAEAWDAAGVYQVGSFPNWGRWAEWNGRFRDDVRRFVRGDPGMVQTLATRMAGSPDLYQTDREPYHSINFVTCHDGFTLMDVASYNGKHNIENGEDERDGHNDNLSWNCGEEGPTDTETVNQLRRRQVKNMAALLLLSHGVPMVLSGDEMGRTQQGNNNAYCQDNEISWIDWELTRENADLVRFFQRLIELRRTHAALRRESFLPDEKGTTVSVEWHGVVPYQPDWSYESRTLAKCLRAITPDGETESIYLIASAYSEPLSFELPSITDRVWYRVSDTSLDAPRDIVDLGKEERLDEQRNYLVQPRSVVVLIGK
uniref:Glycogen operon protein n=1 Tax=Candidatus Kentrum sp. LFY TaxID=2126342 RepID=A0A450UDU1_9GAMM|nr:MAG: glycogen operon protein [Candidatus Kentron sp. LFY]VFJ90567.1 MAG: glycogen operon protein [Candidatus Kentron sp. LFY]VFK20467.1 MAG: glycogen operon protein [Candidatus Kentron sp. LFY]